MKKRLFRCISVVLSIVLFLAIGIANATGFEEYQYSFNKSVGEWGDQCIIYVRYETGIEYSCCNGSAQNCYSQSKACGYSTGDIPAVGSIMVMGAWGSVSTGHDAIVIEVDQNNSERVKVRDSNWALDERIQEHWINTNDNRYGWFKYIYPKNQNPQSNPDPFINVKICGTATCDVNYQEFSDGSMVGWYPKGNCTSADHWFEVVKVDDKYKIGQELGPNDVCICR